jgi:hypothetical protein
MLLGGHVGQEQIQFGQKALRLPAKNVPDAVVAVVERYSTERNFGEDFNAWLTRAGGADQLGSALAELDKFPTFDENADYYVDFGETGPYEANVGDSECAV